MKVVFRKFPEGDVVALFPEEAANGKGHILSYQSAGQHGAASPELVSELAEATEVEYQPLLQELMVRVGYTDLKVITGGEMNS